MPRYPKDINAIYISERMQENLRHIKESAMTSIVAPMGYGKTTAALWYLDERKRKGDQVFRVNIYSSDVNLFWQSFCNAFKGTALGDLLSGMAFPVGQIAIHMLIHDMMDYLSELDSHIFILIDDCHLMEDSTVFDMLFALCNIPTDKLHIIVASRSVVFMRGEELHLGNKLHKLTVDDLRLNRTELSAYLRRCGVDIPDGDFELLFKNSEGWFSCVYLNLRNYEKTGTLLSKGEDIYSMIGDTLYSTYGAPERSFILAMCIADEFTLAQAEFITEDPDTRSIIKSLAQHNAFIRYLPDTNTYRFHHMLRGYAEQVFSQMSDEYQNGIKLRYGKWHEDNEQYIRALKFYGEVGLMSNVLHVMGLDCGVQLASIDPTDVLALLERCTESELMAEPRALLVLMRRLFSWRQIPKMLELKAILLKAADQPELTEEERNNLLGECDLVMSFLGYNDISAMSALHQKAASLMTRSAISTGKTGSYTFGSPSVLMMFHRESGKLVNEVETMNRAMPFYYQITDDHGMGAELVMEAEALYNRGEFTDARIMLERAKQASKSMHQLYLPLCCDFLEIRLSLFLDAELDESWSEKHQASYLRANDPMIFSTLDGCEAYISSILERTDNIPEWIRDGKLSDANLLNPARPMFEIIYNQALLSQKDHIAVLARGQQLLAMCKGISYMLCEIHLHIQLSIANYALGKNEQAKEELKLAFDLALPDGIIMPFAENIRGLGSLLDSFSDIPEISAIKKLGEKLSARFSDASSLLTLLTEREKLIASLYASGKNRKQIADELFLSEGTVRNYISAIYDKLNISGTPKQKHHALLQIINKK